MDALGAPPLKEKAMTMFATAKTAAPARRATMPALAASILNAVKAWNTALRNRREVNLLMNAEDGVLRDLGLTRMDVSAALSEPLWRDPSARLLIWSVERRAAQRAQARNLLDQLEPTPAKAVDKLPC
jgi:uncharacterized protein YjiS (DUF1127 family)